MEDMRMKYEHLLRRVFNCGRYEDPFMLANADVYTHNSGNLGHRLIFGTSAALKALRVQIKENSPELANRIEQMDKNLWKANNADDIDDIILEGHSILDQLNI